MRISLPKLRLFDETGLTRERVTSLKLVIWAVAFGTICFNITGGVAMTGYLKMLGVSDFAFGLIYAIGPVATTLQILASYLLERTKQRKTIFMVSGLLQRFAWLPFGLVPFLVPMSAPVVRIWMAVLFLLLNCVSGPFINVCFYSFAADIVPMNIRGRYFTVRQRVATIIGLIGGIMTAWLLDSYTGFSGYALVFTVAFIGGTTDIAMFFFIKFPPMSESAKTDSMKSMIGDVLKNKRYMKFIGFVTFWTFAASIAGPFYLVYAKTVLNLSNTVITLVTQILASLCAILVLPMWGRALDRYGNKPIMLISGRLFCLAPFIWVFINPGPAAVLLLVIVSIASGLLPAGMDFGAQNLFLGQAPEKNRSMFVAMYTCITALIGTGLGNTTGGWLLDNALPAVENLNLSFNGVVFNRYNLLFFLSACLRCVAVYFLLPRLISGENDVKTREVLRQTALHLRIRIKRMVMLFKMKFFK